MVPEDQPGVGPLLRDLLQRGGQDQIFVERTDIVSDQAIRIGENIKLVVVSVRGDQVRIAIEAPAALSVHRQEVYEAIHRTGNDGDASEQS